MTKRKIEDTSLEKILKAARQLFVAHGFDGTSMGEIAKAAEVNKSLLYHYFATKEELWKRCKENILQTTHNINFAIPTDQGLRAFLEALIMSRYQVELKLKIYRGVFTECHVAGYHSIFTIYLKNS
ncbi:MAG: TetR/AcrR family transcriptional regulator [Gammaproteobacteria bacterium]|nr:TetR/AcrR family transcriptional regulator [Gammaproteobacteria bacterium]